ncbi:MAG: hypothetical protein HRU38_08500 [Saccharospirillaceae bacterium]|nr:hypothetical protein [Pseudomonadales bacterium]NRB78693.1 hypothetical protein [Saccharospirillaceae bacterium]
MSFVLENRQKFEALKFQITNQDQLRKQANGGNSILFTYTPSDEQLYLDKAKEQFHQQAEFIDVSKLLVQIIDKDGWDAFEEYYKDFISTPSILFKSDDPEVDLFDLIIQAIEQAVKNGKIPMMIRSGCLYGTGIENVNIMEHPSVMKLSHPLVIFYPAKVTDENVFFLNFKAASKYRCILLK